MKLVMTIVCASLLAGCATTFSLIDKSDGSIDGNAKLEMKITGEHTASVMLDGKPYEGQWEHKGCSVEICSKYETMTFRHNRHSTLNKANLVAADGARLTCEWVSHLGKLNGACFDEKSKSYLIEKTD
ncbi:hypothetical protein ACLIIZ_08850 [Azonexus caeni]|jgi:hypothetical protein|uniref:hypothetical protein n=1 Tax=Azonexus caeni TaxID=266126 RepID=UPI003A882B0A